MYIPKKFQQENLTQLLSLIKEYPFATLITQDNGDINVTHIPMILTERDEKFYLKAHIAKANPLWKTIENGANVLTIFNGPNCYISPNYYPTKKEQGKAVPTWNYVAVHVSGTINFIHDTQWLYNTVDLLTNAHEAHQAQPWSITDAPKSYIDKMLPAIVGIEILVNSDEIVGKWKLSQNHPIINQEGVVDGLKTQSPVTSQNKAPAQAIADMIQKRLVADDRQK